MAVLELLAAATGAGIIAANVGIRVAALVLAIRAHGGAGRAIGTLRGMTGAGGGSLLGGVLLGIIESLSKAYISSQMADAIVFGVLIVVLLVKPAGLFGKYVPEKV